ncbi:MAG TPA: hypothetical protein VJH34_02850 [archaeon]|nr:hypothetical protein [archaeon]
MLRSNKGQFFVLSAVVIISIIFLLGRLLEPSNIVDTSSVVLNDAPFIFNNIEEKAKTTVNSSKTCEDATFNLQEYKDFVESYVLGKGYYLSFTYTLTSCPNFSADVTQILKTTDTTIQSNYILTWS